jgi:hypothetical protein
MNIKNTEKKRAYVVAVGSIQHGFNTYGPFDDCNEAMDFGYGPVAETLGQGAEWEYFELVDPTEVIERHKELQPKEDE